MIRLRITVSAIALLVSTMLSAHHGPGKIPIDAAKAKQPAVTFDHAKHATTLVKSCDTCHHTNKGLVKAHAEKTEVKKCSGCHLEAKGKTPSMREMSLTKNPMHIRCVGCHKDNKKGPTACNGCHKKA